MTQDMAHDTNVFDEEYGDRGVTEERFAITGDFLVMAAGAGLALLVLGLLITLGVSWRLALFVVVVVFLCCIVI